MSNRRMVTNIKAVSVREAIALEVNKLQGTWKQIAYEKDGDTEPKRKARHAPAPTCRLGSTTSSSARLATRLKLSR
jgi:hypothetical protein